MPSLSELRSREAAIKNKDYGGIGIVLGGFAFVFLLGFAALGDYRNVSDGEHIAKGCCLPVIASIVIGISCGPVIKWVLLKEVRSRINLEYSVN